MRRHSTVVKSRRSTFCPKAGTRVFLQTHFCFAAKIIYWVLTLKKEVVNPELICSYWWSFRFCMTLLLRTHDEGWAHLWIWLRVLTLDRRFVYQSTKARPRNADSSSEVPDVRQGYANTNAGLPIRSTDVRSSNDDDADVCPLTRSRDVCYDTRSQYPVVAH